MSKIVITGVSSFVGYHLALKFNKERYRVVGTINSPASPISKQRIASLEENKILIHKLDICNKSELREFIRAQAPDYWIHHAGWASDYHSLDYDVAKGFAINVEPLDTLYEGLAETPCKGVIITGTNAEYSPEVEAASEEDSCYPTLPYGISKLEESMRAKQLAYQYNIRTRVARVFIPYGALDAPEKLIPSVIQALRNKTDIELTACTQARDFLYIDDLTEIYAKLIADMKREPVFDLFNACSGRAVVLKDLLLKIAETLNTESAFLRFGELPVRVGEPAIIYGNNNKAKLLLNWEPRNIAEGIVTYIKDTVQ